MTCRQGLAGYEQGNALLEDVREPKIVTADGNGDDRGGARQGRGLGWLAFLVFGPVI